MLSEIEEFTFGGNTAHDLVELLKINDQWLISISPCYDHKIVKKYLFHNVQEKYEEDLTDDGEVVEYPLPIIGFDSKQLPSGMWLFCLNAADIEWGFISEWPTNA